MLHALLRVAAPIAAVAAGGEGLKSPQPPSEIVFNIGPLPIYNTVFTAWFVIAIMVLFAYFSTRHMKELPTGVQNFWEMIVELWVGLVEQSMGRRGRRFLVLIATVFLFILFSNWLGVLPGVGDVLIRNPQGEVVPLFRSANSDLNLTAAMAVAVILVTEFFELKSLGPLGYVKGLLIPNPLRWLEIVTRPLSLSFRLFGNIFAGEVLIFTMINVAWPVLFVFLAMELFVGLIQALIFSMLTLVYLTMATAHEHAEHSEHAEHAAEPAH